MSYLNFGNKLRSVGRGLKSFIVEQVCSSLYIRDANAVVGWWIMERQSHRQWCRTTGCFRPPPRILSSHSLTPLLISWRKEVQFGSFPDVCHAAEPSISKSLTRGQLCISEHGGDPTPKVGLSDRGGRFLTRLSSISLLQAARPYRSKKPRRILGTGKLPLLELFSIRFSSRDFSIWTAHFSCAVTVKTVKQHLVSNVNQSIKWVLVLQLGTLSFREEPISLSQKTEYNTDSGGSESLKHTVCMCIHISGKSLCWDVTAKAEENCSHCNVTGVRSPEGLGQCR